MAFEHGRKAIFKIQNAGGTLVDLSDYLNSVSYPREVDTAEVSTFGVDSKQYIPGLKDGTISIEGRYDPTVISHMNGIRQMLRTYEYGPQGDTTGKDKYTGTCFLTSLEFSTEVGDAGNFSAEFQVSGDDTYGAYA